MFEEFSFKIENGNKSIKETIICISNKDKKLFSQLLKIPEVLLFNKHKKAKGDNKISIFVRIYLNVNVITKLIDDIDNMLVSNPSMEKILKLFLETPESSFIKEEKEILLLKILLPSPQMNSVIS